MNFCQTLMRHGLFNREQNFLYCMKKYNTMSIFKVSTLEKKWMFEEGEIENQIIRCTSRALS